MELSLPNLELELIDLLASQGLPIEEIHLIGLLGKGTRATVFSVIIDGVYHALKVYDSRESLQAELKNLRKVIPKDRFLFWWEAKVDGSKLNIVIIEVPEGSQLSSAGLNKINNQRIAMRMAELHELKYRQFVSVSSLQRQLRRIAPIFLAMIINTKQEIEPYEALLNQLANQLTSQPDLFRVPKVRIHGDLWWPNVIIAKEDAYLVDWEDLTRDDAAVDICKLRLIVFFINHHNQRFFWEKPEDGNRVGALMKEIVSQHRLIAGDQTLLERLKFYLPFKCIQILAERYLDDATQSRFERAANCMLAKEVLNLAKNPLGNTPNLKDCDYFPAITELRSSSTILTGRS